MVSSRTEPKQASSAVDVGKRIRVRSYEASDYDQVLDIYVAGLLSYAEIPGQSKEFWQDYIDHSLQDDMADIHAAYFARGGHFWLAVVDTDNGDQEIVGIIALDPTEKGEGELRRMSVKPAYRRYGVGRLLVEALEQWAKENDFTRVFLLCGYVLEKAHHFYKALGYTHFKDSVFHDDPLFIAAHFEKRLQ